MYDIIGLLFSFESMVGFRMRTGAEPRDHEGVGPYVAWKPKGKLAMFLNRYTIVTTHNSQMTGVAEG